MFEETNQAERQEELPEKLFGDEEGTAEAEVETQAEPEDVQTLKIKYNGKEQEISLDEARVLAQKGMNYDHVLAERDTKYQRELSALDKLAAERNMTREQYVEFAERQTTIPRREAEKSPQSRAREQIKRIHEETDRKFGWNKLFDAYPELSRAEAKRELSESVRSGRTPLEAHQMRIIKAREDELAIMRNNSEAAKRAIGSLTGDFEGSAKDAFLEGFLAQ